SPIVVTVDCAGARMPDPAIVFGVSPVAVGIQVFATPNITIVILCVVTQSLRQVTLAFLDPVVPGISSVGSVRGNELPVTGVVSLDDKLGSTSIAQLKSGGL